VTSAALILFMAFVSMASGPETDVKVFATGLAAGIMLDATVIRAVLVPAVVSLFGHWNWWLPTRPAVGCAWSRRCRRRRPPGPRRSPGGCRNSTLRLTVTGFRSLRRDRLPVGQST
jgi:RND superfamily putative drug exporter